MSGWPSTRDAGACGCRAAPGRRRARPRRGRRRAAPARAGAPAPPPCGTAWRRSRRRRRRSPATFSLQRSRAVRISTGIVRPCRAASCSSTRDAVHLRQAEVEHHGIVGLGVAEEVALLAVGGEVDRIAGIAQAVVQLPRQIGIVFDHQDPHRARLLVPGLSGPRGCARCARRR